MVEFNKDWLKMSNRRIINSIHLVTGCGMGDEYIVGENEVTRITRELRPLNENEQLLVFVIYKGTNVVAEINTNTPFVLKYKE